jgi:hypothetical protein
MIPPKPVSGFSREAAWSNRLINYFRSKVLLPGRGYRIRQYPNGIALDIEQSGGGGKSDPGTKIKNFRLVSHHEEFLTCVDDSLKDTDPNYTVTVYKPALLRFSVLFRGSHGLLIGYTNYDVTKQERLAVAGSNSEQQVIVDSYEVGDTIWGMNVSETGQIGRIPTRTIWVDMNIDGRYWASK